MRLPDAGTRISLRRQSPDGVHDIVGDVVEVDAGHLVLQPWDRPAARVPLDELVVWRAVPPKAVRPSSTPADLARLASRGWPGLETQRLGGWELHAGGGYTSRANSALPEGDPGMALDDALATVLDFYAARGVRPALQLASRPGQDHPLAATLAERGWAPHGPALLMVRDLRSAGGDDLGHVHWREVPDAAWLRAQGRPHPLRSAVLTAAPALFLTVDGPGPDAVPAAIARIAPTADWIGVSCLWVDPAQRRQGLGRAVLTACCRRGRELGARFAYLQVERDNGAARSLYEQLGWSVHHDYVYWSPDAA